MTVTNPFAEVLATAAHITAPENMRQWQAPEGWQVSPEITDTLSQLATIQDRTAPRLNRVRVAAFAGDCDTARARLKAIQAIEDPLSHMCEKADSELRVYELDTQGQALTPEDLARAVSYGMMAVEPGLDGIVPVLLSDRAVLGGSDFESLLMVNERADVAAFCGLFIAAGLARVPILLNPETKKLYLKAFGKDVMAYAVSCVIPMIRAQAGCEELITLSLLKSLV